MGVTVTVIKYHLNLITKKLSFTLYLTLTETTVLVQHYSSRPDTFTQA